MIFNCRQSCESCISLHVGETQYCPSREDLDGLVEELVKTQRYVYDVASSDGSFSKVSKCTNRHGMCSYWAMNGECEANPGYMREDCSAACQTCWKDK